MDFDSLPPATDHGRVFIPIELQLFCIDKDVVGVVTIVVVPVSPIFTQHIEREKWENFGLFDV